MNKIKLFKSLIKDRTDVSWYKMEVKNDVADIYIYDEISWYGVSAEQFVKDLNAIEAKTIRLHLNTLGGSVFDGIAIYNALKQHKATVETYIEGLAASIGSVIALAGDKVYMADNAFFMIHQPWVLTVGDASELRKTADLLDKIGSVLVNTYIKASGKDEEDIKKWMDEETWFTAAEALDAGFIDEITDRVEAKAEYDLEVYDNVPETLLAEFKKHSQGEEKEDKEPGQNMTRKIRESMRMRLKLETV